jgi:GDPmannose 4,6-dehydratase
MVPIWPNFFWRRASYGIKLRALLFNTQRVDHIYQYPHFEHQRFILHYDNLT